MFFEEYINDNNFRHLGLCIVELYPVQSFGSHTGPQPSGLGLNTHQIQFFVLLTKNVFAHPFLAHPHRPCPPNTSPCCAHPRRTCPRLTFVPASLGRYIFYYNHCLQRFISIFVRCSKHNGRIFIRFTNLFEKIRKEHIK
jgi:hypothetical protein